jgi:fructokinase
MPLYGAVEAGGTKFLCAVANEPGALREIRRFETAQVDPGVTMRQVTEYFRAHPGIAAIGVASFGPIDFATGAITSTPKLAWQDFPLRATLERALGVPVALDTDVNGAALGEAMAGAGQGLQNLVYLTIGTGIGGGALVNGALVHGLLHPEMGHMSLRPAPEEVDGFTGVCPFHRNCLEGLASGPAMRARWEVPAEDLPDDHAAWKLEAYYLAQAAVNLSSILSPERIIFGGGVTGRASLLAQVRHETANILNGYLRHPRLLGGMEDYIVAAALPYPALTGAVAMAQRL